MLSLQVIGGEKADQVSSNASRTPDGGLILGLGTNSVTGPIASSFCNTPSSRALFIKYNSDATAIEWSRCRQNSWSDTGYGYMNQTADGKYVLGGVANSGNNWVVRKEDATGNVLWIKAYGGSSSQMLYSMMAAGDGGYILFGSAYGGDGDIGFHYGSAATRDFWVLKVDANGDKVWSKVYGGTGEDIGGSVVAAPGGGCYIVGSTNSADYECTGNHGATEAFAARLDAGGNIVWRKMLGGSGNDGGGENEGCRAVPDGKGGLLIATISGSADGDVSHQINNPGSNIWLIDIDSAGSIVWDNCYGGGGAEYPNSVCYATDGSIWIMGCSQTAGGQVNAAYGSRDAYVVHADGAGNFISAKVLGSTAQDVGYIIHPLSDGLVLGGGYYMQGNGSFPNIHHGFSDAFLVKFTNWPDNVADISLADAISVYPNPARELVNVGAPVNRHGSVAVSDVLGRVVYTNAITNQLQITVRDWQAGIYYVRVKGEDGSNAVQKLVVQ